MAVAPPIPGWKYGIGCDSQLGRINNFALDAFDPDEFYTKNAPPEGERGGQTIEFSLQQIEKSEDLCKALDISVSGAYSGAFSVSAEGKYVNTRNINKYSVYLLVSVRVINPEITIPAPRRLNPIAQQLLEDEGWDVFQESYGTEFVSGAIIGGSYYGLIEVMTTSESEREEIKAGVKFGGFGAKASVDVKHELTSTLSDKRTQVTILQTGGRGDVLEVTLEDMIEQARNFPMLAANNPRVFQLIYTPYRGAVELPRKIGGSVMQRDNRADVLKMLGRDYYLFRDLRSNISYVIDNMVSFEKYKALDTAERNAARDRLRADYAGVNRQLQLIEDAAERCQRSISDCAMPDERYVMTEELPDIEGQNMKIKDMEEQLVDLQTTVDELQELLKAVQAPTQADRLQLQPSGTLYGAGRMHLHSDEMLYLLPKGGVHITRDWGASGDLNVVGSLNMEDGSTVSSTGTLNVKANGQLSLGAKDGFRVPKSDADSGDLHVGNNIYMQEQTLLKGSGRLHIESGEVLYLLPTDGVRVSKVWGGNGNLVVEGGVYVGDVPVWDGTDDNDMTWNNENGGQLSREGSSERYKQNIEPLQDDFQRILDVEPKRYQMREGYGNQEAWQFGYLAEDLHAAGLTQFVIYDKEGRPDGVKYKKMAIYANEVLKDQQERIQMLVDRVTELEAKALQSDPGTQDD